MTIGEKGQIQCSISGLTDWSSVTLQRLTSTSPVVLLSINRTSLTPSYQDSSVIDRQVEISNIGTSVAAVFNTSCYGPDSVTFVCVVKIKEFQWEEKTQVTIQRKHLQEIHIIMSDLCLKSSQNAINYIYIQCISVLILHLY